ncbi:MAG TPA: hypothetical protein VIO94_15760 [Phenylobacterium sp.]
MIRSTITDHRLNAPFYKSEGIGFQVCPKPRFLTKAQVVLIIIVALGALASVGVAVGGF